MGQKSENLTAPLLTGRGNSVFSMQVLNCPSDTHFIKIARATGITSKLIGLLGGGRSQQTRVDWLSTGAAWSNAMLIGRDVSKCSKVLRDTAFG